MIINGTQLGLQQNIRKTNDNLQKSMGKLASGKRITSASVDAAGLAISEKLRALQRGSRQALQNVQDAQSMVQTADSAMQEMTHVVQRIRELTIQAMNGTNTNVTGSGSNADTLLIQNEIDELKKNLGEIVKRTEFNTKKLLTNDEPGDYLIADRRVTTTIPAMLGSSGHNVIMGTNAVELEAQTYNRQVNVSTSTYPISDSTVSNAPVDVAMSTVIDHFPKWSSDGAAILFSSTRDGQNYKVIADGSSNPEVDAGTASAPLKSTAGNYRLQVIGSTIELQEKIGTSSWGTKASYSYFSSDGSQGYSFSPKIDAEGNTSFVFSDGTGNVSKVDLNINTGIIGPVESLIPKTDTLNLPPQNNTLTLSYTPDLYRMNETNASLVVKKMTDSGPKTLTYWDGIGSEPSGGYYRVSGNQVTFFGEAIIGKETLDDAQDYYTIQYVRGNGSDSFHTESIPSGAQLYNLHGEPGPMSLKITVGGRLVQRGEFLTGRPADIENTTGVFVNKSANKIEFYGDLRPSAIEEVQITYMSDTDNDRNVQTHSLPAMIDTYNLDAGDATVPRSLEVYVGGRKIEYDDTKTDGYTYDPNTRKISIYGNSRPNIQNGEQISFKYIADSSQTSTEVYGIYLGSTKPDIFSLGVAGTPNSIRVYRGSEEIAYSDTDGFQYNEQTNTIELFGNSRPNVGDVYSVRIVAVTGDLIKNDNKIEIPLNSKPEIYGMNDPDIPSTLKVTVGGREIQYDANKQDGFYYNSTTNRIEIYGNSRPDANDLSSTYSPSISVQFVKESNAATLNNYSYDIQMATGASSYGIDGTGSVKGMKVVYAGIEVPYEEQNGFTYDQTTGVLSLHGSFRPTAQDSAGSYRVYSVPEQSLSASVSSGSTIHKVMMNGVEVQPADHETGNGYVVEAGKVRLVGDARPDVATGYTSYNLSVIYTEPLSIGLPVDPLSTATTAYCEHETGSALPDAEWIPESLSVKLNDVLLTPDQYNVEGNRVSLITDKVTVNLGNNQLTADYQVRQGINYKENSYTFQVGGNVGNQKTVKIAAFDNMLQNIGALCVRTPDHAEQGLQIVDQSLDFILRELGNIGAAENSFHHIAANLEVSEENLISALSRIEDVDMAKEIMNTTKLQILSQAQQALTGQARQMHESVLKLLQ